MQPKTGELVKLEEFGGRIIERRVLSVDSGRVVVCSEQEYNSAMRANRRPDGIAFALAAVRSRPVTVP
jgi:hypothetical protein